MEFKRQQDGFYLENSEHGKYAEVTFSTVGDEVLVLDHTFVHEQYRGQHIGQNLIAEVVKMARAENKKIIPLCPFSKAEFERMPEYTDVKR